MMNAEPANLSQDHPAPWDPTRSLRRVLFASSSTQWPISAMLKADAFAQSLRAELLVLHVSNVRPSFRSLFRRSPGLDVLGALEHLERARAETLERCNYILPNKVPSENLFIRSGDFAGAIQQTVSECGADLIVIPPEQKGQGLLAMDLAIATGVPVLIARPPRSHNVVVGATNLADSRYPVIRQVRQVSGLLGAQTLLMHNVAPVQLPGGLERGSMLLQVSSEQDVDSSAERLAEVSRQLPRALKAVVKTESNTAQAILETARECDADLVVLGVAHPCSRFARLFGGGVPSRVAERAHRSILLTPIAASSAAQATPLLQA